MIRLFILGFLILLLCAIMMGCSSKESSTTPKSPSRPFDVKIYCYEGIEYFATWNNNAFSSPALTGAVIDKETLQPKKCDK